MKYIFTLALAISTLASFSQERKWSTNYLYKTYNWDKQAKNYKPTESEKQSDLVLIKEFNVLETAYEKDGQAVIYETHHRIYHVNSQKGIDQINKVYIPTSQVNEEVDLRARCITADNKIIPFNTDNIKRVDNLENSGPYTIFSIDGVDVGCDVEYIYTNKHVYYPYVFYKIQNRLPMNHYEFHVISPKNLVYDTKCYNTAKQFVSDTSDENRNHLVFTIDNLEEVGEEKYSASDASKIGFSIQLGYNNDKGKAKIYTWETIANNYYNNLFVIEKNEQKTVEKFIDKNKIGKAATDEAKIIALENLVKLNYGVSKSGGYETMAKSLDNKSLSEGDALRLYIAAFKYLKIPFELVFTTDRMNKKFDSKLPSYIFLEDILFYFPTLNKYTSPLEALSRLGFANPNNMSNEGLFVKEIMMGDIGAPTSKIKSIPSNDYLQSYHNYDVKVTIDPSALTANLNVTQDLMGYSIYYIQPIYGLLNDDQKKEVNESYYAINKPDLTKNVIVRNFEKEDIFNKPMQISYTQELPDVIESAGEKFIFKVGELIGPQTELYQEKKRKTDGDIYYTHFMKRVLEIKIPENYKVVNAEDLKINKKCMLDGKEAAQFLSEYKIEADKIIVTVYEDYRAMNYPLANFNDFKEVINAAADFNKKTLVFEKK